MKQRLDQLVVERGLAPSRTRAAALILAGDVLVNGVPQTKAGTAVAVEAVIVLRRPDHPFVSRGGVKLAHALQQFHLDVHGLVCLDAGASTGGFTDCLLQAGAARVYAVDVGKGQLAWALQQDPRVIVWDATNLRTLDPQRLPERLDLVTLDLAFISLTKVFATVGRLLRPGGAVLALIKPQFEVGKGHVGKGGIVRDAGVRDAAVAQVVAVAQGLDWRHHGRVESPLTGADGNVEFLAHFTVPT
ncbi:MAG: TlyA family RNA methyltransferase [Deltaproteobacteria bacterium]|nr:TlyA family RNA methyltransferase [Deltaproteobacteria bacterium]